MRARAINARLPDDATLDAVCDVASRGDGQARDRSELHLCLLLNRLARRHAVRAFFASISRAGDGIAWYLLMLALPLFDGRAGLQASLHLAAVGLVSLVLYLAIKQHTRRPRPYMRYRSITRHIAALDEFSFPSGHTLHAVAFTLVAVHHYPALALVLWPFAAAIALSRVVLGVHYPSDVLAATVIGAVLAHGSIALVG